MTPPKTAIEAALFLESVTDLVDYIEDTWAEDFAHDHGSAKDQLELLLSCLKQRAFDEARDSGLLPMASFLSEVVDVEVTGGTKEDAEVTVSAQERHLAERVARAAAEEPTIGGLK